MDPFHCVAWATGEELNLGFIHGDCYSRIALIKDVERLYEDWRGGFDRYYVAVKIPRTKAVREIKDDYDMEQVFLDFDDWGEEVIDFVVQPAPIEERQLEPEGDDEQNDHSTKAERANVDDSESVEDEKGPDAQCDSVGDEVDGEDDEGSEGNEAVDESEGESASDKEHEEVDGESSSDEGHGSDVELEEEEEEGSDAELEEEERVEDEVFMNECNDTEDRDDEEFTVDEEIDPMLEGYQSQDQSDIEGFDNGTPNAHSRMSSANKGTPFEGQRDLDVDMTFESVYAFRSALKDYRIREGFRIRQKFNDVRKYAFRCVGLFFSA